MTTNRLIDEKSPYLLQHAHNPVEWYPWSEMAFEAAHRLDKPVFLSIGYATCHWCHVMEKESFEDKEAAGFLNDTFICIKVDREERPDIDAVYMAACQMITGSGGWPLTIFMTPGKKPFFAATYLPKNTRFGRAGIVELCQQVKDLWVSQKNKLTTSADNIAGHLDQAFTFSAASDPDAALLERAYSDIEQSFDSRFGGFDSAPKFPTPHRLLYLLRCYHRAGNPHALEMVEKTLTEMRLGGIWDHVGFGFHRYSTDRRWLLPHFEKMLYDQALLALAYIETYQITRNPFFARTAREIFAYVLRDMQAEQGGFFSAEDADSEGEEGKFYIWPEEEFRTATGDEAAGQWARALNVEPGGNFHDEASGAKTGANILHLKLRPDELARKMGLDPEAFLHRWEGIRTRLFQERKKRVHPLKDDKVLADWNGLMVAALSRGGRILGDAVLTRAAVKAAKFLLETMRNEDGRLYHRYRDGEVAVSGQAADYAYFVFGLLELYQATFDPAWLENALSLQQMMLTDFWDAESGGFYSTAAATLDLPVRPKELYDGALPSANSVALYNMLCLARITGDAHWDEYAHLLVRSFSGTVASHPSAFTFLLVGLDFALNPGQEVVITGEPDASDTLEMLQALNINFTPNKITLVKTDRNAERLAGIAGYTDGLQVVQGKATAHICRGTACKESTTEVSTLIRQIAGKERGSIKDPEKSA